MEPSEASYLILKEWTGNVLARVSSMCFKTWKQIVSKVCNNFHKIDYTHSTETAHCKIVSADRYLDTLNVLREGKLFDVFETGGFGPVTTTDQMYVAVEIAQVFLDDRKEL